MFLNLNADLKHIEIRKIQLAQIADTLLVGLLNDANAAK